MTKVEEGFLERREDVGKSLDVPFFVFDAADEPAVKAACDADPEDSPYIDVGDTGPYCNRHSS